MGRRLAAWMVMMLVTTWLGGGCQPPRAPPGELTTFNPPRIQVLRPQRLRTPTELVLAAPLPVSVDIVPRTGHAAEVVGVDVESDGELAVTASSDGTVKIWDLYSGALLRTVREDVAVGVALILGDGGRLLTAGVDGALRLRALSTGQLLRTVPLVPGGSASPISALAVTPDGSRVVVAHGPGALAIYDLQAGQRVQEVATSARIGALRFTADGEEVLAGDDSGGLRRYDGATLELRRSIAGHAREVTALDTSADGRRVLSASGDGRLKLWDVASGALLTVLSAHARPIRGVAVSHDARSAVSASEDGTVKLWDLEEQRAVATMTGHAGAVTCVAAARGHEGVVTGGADGTVRLWDFDAGEAVVVLPAHDDATRFASFSASGLSALSASAVGELRLWDLGALAVSRQWVGAAPLTAAALSPDATQVLTASPDARGGSSVALWDVDLGRVVHRFEARSGAVTSAAFAPLGQRALTGSTHGAVQVWGTAVRRSLRELIGHTSPVRGLALSADGQRALSGAVAPMVGPDRVKLWDLDAGAELASFDGYAVGAFTFGGDEAVLGSREGRLSVLDLEAGVVTRSWDGHTAAVRALAADRRGRIVASGDEHGVVKLWDNHRERLVRTLAGHSRAVHTLGFSADGRRLVSASEDGTLRVWRVDSGDSVALVARGEEWLVFSDDGYFAASPRGAELAYAVAGRQGYRLDQLAVLHNRPDLLLERIGGGSAALMEDFAARHQRRLRALGLTQESIARSFVAAPRVAITKLEQRGRLLTVSFQVATEGVAARYQLLLNGVPWLRETKPVADGVMREDVLLSGGRNRLEIHVTDDAGAKAIPASHVVRSDETRRGVLHYVGIGVSRYDDSGLNTKYARRDALGLGRALESARGAFRDVRVHTLLDEGATGTAIAGLKQAIGAAEVDDTVILFVAGQLAHTRAVPADPVFLPRDADVARLVETTVSVATLGELLGATKARRRLLILDGCVSGDRDDTELRLALNEASRRSLIARQSPALRLPPAMAPRPFLFESHQLVMGAATELAGTVLLRASRGRELCYELDDLKSGALTAAVLRALSTPEADVNRDGWVSLEELNAFVGPAVANLTGGLQHPVLFRGGVEEEIALPRIRELSPPTDDIEHPLTSRPPPGCACGVDAGRRDASARWLALVVLVWGLRRRQ